MKLSEAPTGVPTAPSPVVAIQSPLMSVDAQPCLDTSSSVLLEVTDEVPDWEALYNALAESVIVSATQIAELTCDSEEVCTQLSLLRAYCVKLEEALGVAQKDAELGKVEAQDIHMRLIASQKEVKKLNDLSDVATKATKGHLKRLERLGVREEELMQACKLNTQASIDLTELLRQNKVLVKKNEAKKPLPQHVPLKNLIKAFPKVHMVGVEDRLQASVAWSQSVAQNAVYTVFESLYTAMESSCDIVADRWTSVEEQVNAKALGLEANAC